MDNDCLVVIHKMTFSNQNYSIRKLQKVQLGPRYEGQLNPMAEPIPHEVRPLVRTHDYHPYHAADRHAETDSWV